MSLRVCLCVFECAHVCVPVCLIRALHHMPYHTHITHTHITHTHITYTYASCLTHQTVHELLRGLGLPILELAHCFKQFGVRDAIVALFLLELCHVLSRPALYMQYKINNMHTGRACFPTPDQSRALVEIVARHEIMIEQAVCQIVIACTQDVRAACTDLAALRYSPRAMCSLNRYSSI